MRFAHFRGHLNRFNGNPNDAANTDRIPGVDEQIDQHLLQLSCIRFGHAGFRIETQINRNIRPQNMTHHAAGLPNHLVNIDRRHANRRLARKYQQLLNNLRCSFCGIADQLRMRLDCRRIIGRKTQHFSSRQNYGQHVIHVVGDSACNSSNAFYFLCLNQLLFKTPTLGDIFHGYFKIDKLAVLIVDRPVFETYLENGSVARFPVNLGVDRNALLARFDIQRKPVRFTCKNITIQIQLHDFINRFITQHPHQGGVDREKNTILRCLINPFSYVLKNRTILLF